MNPAVWMYRNGYLLWLTIAVVLMAGGSAFLNLPREEDPRIVQRGASVLTLLPGSSAERVEALVTEVLEREIREVDDIKTIDSTSRAGVSRISIELKDAVTAGENVQIFSEVRDRINDARALLPAEASEPVFDDRMGAVAFTLVVGVTWVGGGGGDGGASPGVATPGLYGGVGSSGAAMGVMDRLSRELEDRLRNVVGTELVRRYGEPTEEVLVSVDGDRLAELGLTVADVAARLRGADTKVPTGRVRGSGSDLVVEVAGDLETLERVREVPLVEGDGEGPTNLVVRVGDVAEVRRGWEEPVTEVGWSAGRRTVFVGARLGEGQQVGEWAARAREVVAEFAAEVGGAVEVETVFDQSSYTEERLGELGLNLVLGAGVIVVVVVLTMGLRSALIVGTALPLVSALTLFGVLLNGGALHQMSIFGMIIALGLLIDNAIVVVDEVGKELLGGASDGHTPAEAGVPRDVDREGAVDRAVRHLAGPLFASTLTTVLAFAPIMLLPGSGGDFIGYIGISVAFAITASYGVSLTVVAALAGRFLGVRPTDGIRGLRGLGWLRGGVGGPGLGKVTRVGLRWGLRVPLVLALLAALPALWGFGVSGGLGRAFFPPTDRDMFDLQVWMPASSSLERTEAEVEAIHKALMATPGVEKVDWLIGGSFPTVYYNLIMNQEETPFYARASVKTSSIADTERLVPAVQRALDEGFPAAQVVVKEFGQGPPVVADVEYRITGPDPAVLQRLGEVVRKRLQEHPEVLHTRMSMPRGEPKLWLAASEDAARQVGLTLRGLAEQTQAKLDGVTGGSVNEGLEQMPVRVRLGEGVRRDPSAIGSLRYVNEVGDAVPVSALGGLELRPELGGITRYNGVRSNVVSAYTVVGSLPIDISAAVLEELTDGDGVGDLELPAGYAIGVGGATEQDADAIGNLLIFVPILLTVMVAALILTFRSLRLAGLLGVVAVMSVGFALLATWAADFPISFNMILGSLGLIGLALNDTIVVVAAIRADPEARAGDKDAVVRATLSCGRHVVSTTLTTIGGFMPLLLLSEGDFWPQLAIVLAGGVGGATLLAMGLIPAAYVMLFRSRK